MNTEDEKFLSAIQETYVPDEMSAKDIRRFNTELREKTAKPRGIATALVLAFAVTTVALVVWAGSFTFGSSPTVETVLEGSERQVMEIATLEADDLALQLSLLELEDGAFDEMAESEWLPEDYQVLAILINSNNEEELIP